MKYFMGIDVGTYSSKGVVVGSDGRIVAQESKPHETAMPHPGWAEHEADGVWWQDLCTIARALIRRSGLSPSDIAGVGTSGIAPCVLPLSKDGKPLRPAILYGIDTRATAEINELSERLGKDWIVEHSGAGLSAQSAGPKVLWIRRHEPDVWKQARYFVTSTSYLVYRLTGRLAIDHYTAAFYGPLYDLGEQRWSAAGSAEVCSLDTLAPPRWTSEIAGYVTAEAAEQTGLAEGTPVITGTADAAAEAVTAGVLKPEDTMLMFGSSLFIIRVFDRKPEGGVFWPAPFLFPGTYALAGGMSTSGAVTQWFREEFAHEERAAEEKGGANAYEALAESAERIPAGAEGLMALPYFSGERTPLNDPDARGVIAGLTLSHTRAHVYRALLEAVAFGVRHNLEAMGERVGAGSSLSAGSLVAIGGGAANRVWMQIIADVMGQSFMIRTSPGAPYGDAALAAVGTGFVERSDVLDWVPEGERVDPDPANHETYTRLYRVYRDLYPSAVDALHTLAQFGRE